MRSFLVILAVILSGLSHADPARAEGLMTDTFGSDPQTRWRFFADTVMGGVSSGQAEFRQDGTQSFARLSGQVSTANNGGFLQIRTDLPDAAPVGATGVRLIVRGLNPPYFVHLRTSGTILPWQYYQAGFPVTDAWTEVRLPFSGFKRSGPMLRAVPRANALTSIGIVAFGRDHQAQIDVAEVGFY